MPTGDRNTPLSALLAAGPARHQGTDQEDVLSRRAQTGGDLGHHHRCATAFAWPIPQFQGLGSPGSAGLAVAETTHDTWSRWSAVDSSVRNPSSSHRLAPTGVNGGEHWMLALEELLGLGPGPPVFPTQRGAKRLSPHLVGFRVGTRKPAGKMAQDGDVLVHVW